MNRTIRISKVIFSALLIVGSMMPILTAQASATFNNDPLDLPTLQAGNSTTQSGTQSWSYYVSGNAGDVLAFRVYYHNTSNETAQNTKVRATLPSGSFTTNSASATLSANNASPVTGNVQINLTSSQTLTYIPGSVKWYPNRSSSPQTLLSGQTGDEIMTSGLSLGDIAPGWATQGYVVFQARVGSQQQGGAPIVNTMSATNVGQNSATLNGTVNPNGSNTTAWFEYGTTQSLGSTIGNQSIGSGSSALNVNAFLSGLQQSTTYYFRVVAQNSFGMVTGSILSFTTGQGGQQGSAPTAVTMAASGIGQSSATLNGTVNPNGSNTTAWFEYGTTPSLGQMTSNQSLGGGNSALNINSLLSSLQQNTTYYFRVVAQNSYGTTQGSTLSFTTSGQQGSAPTVVTNAATNITQNSATLNGTVNPNNSNTNVWFEYGTTQSLGNTVGNQSLSGNSTLNINALLGGLQTNTTYYFRAVAQNSYGTSYGSVANFTTSGQQGSAPMVNTLSASNITQTSAVLNGQVNPNGSNTTAWFEYGTTQSLGTTIGTQSLVGNSMLNINASLNNLQSNTTYYFRVVAQNSYGTSQGSILSFTTGQGGQQGSAPTAVTMAASGIGQSSATLNGTVNPNGSNTTAWFEYGTTPSLGQMTSNQSLGGGNSTLNINSLLSSLQQNTTYYFRVVAQNSYGTTQGSTLSFTTSGQQGSAPTVVTNAATNITDISATLNGSVNPNNANATAWFEFGTTQSLGTTIGTQSLGAGSSALNINALAQNLQPSTTYYFRVMAQNSFGTSQGSILSFTTTQNQQGGAPIVTTLNASNITQTSATLNGTVNPNGSNTTAWFEYGTTQSLGTTIGTQSLIGSSNLNINTLLSGLQQNTTYYFRVAAQNSYGTAQGSILSFSTTGQQGSAPTAVTNSATNITQTSATLNGTVNPNGSNTTAWFEYGTTQSLGTVTGSQSLVGSNSLDINSTLSNLQSNTTYYFRVVAQNSYGTSQGSILSFTTGQGGQQGSAPTVTTNSATNITQNSATLNGTVNPNNSNTNVWFEYGTTQSLGSTIGNQSIGSGNSQININTFLSGLQNNTTYYFRAVAQNSYGTTQGSILSFTTSQGGQQGSAPTVTTNSATNIGQNYATLNGQVNPNGSNTNTWFEYGTTQSLGYTIGNQSVGSGNSTTNITSYLSSLSYNTTYYFRAVAQNNYGTVYGSILTFSTGQQYGGCTSAPTVYSGYASSITNTSVTLNGNVNPNGANANAWFEYGTTYNLGYTTGYQSVGSFNYSSNITGYVSGLLANTTYYYRVDAQNSCGTNYGNVVTFYTTGGGNVIYGNAPVVTTNAATYIYKNSALLNGSVNPNGSLTNAWYEWGTTTAFGNTTPYQPMGDQNTTYNFSYALTGLSANTIYYYRADAQNSYGTTYGNIMSFTTQAAPYVAPPVQPQQPTVIVQRVYVGQPETPSPITLSLTLDNTQPDAGNEVTLTVVYSNGSNHSIKNTVLKVNLPNEVTYENVNIPPTSINGNTLTFNLGTVPAHTQGSMVVKVRINDSVSASSAIVFSASLEFTDPNGDFQSVSAFINVIVNRGAGLSASLIGFLGTLFGNWLFDLLLGLVLGFGIYHFFIRSKETELAT